MPIVGVAGILRKEQEMWENTDRSLQEAFQDLNALMEENLKALLEVEERRARCTKRILYVRFGEASLKDVNEKQKQAIDNVGHDKASVFKVKGLEAVDCAIGQLARLLWEAESTGKFIYYLCVTGDHSTPVEYGDHSFEPVPFALCSLKDFVSALGGESVLSGISLDPFPLPSVQAGEDLDTSTRIEEDQNKKLQFLAGDLVDKFSEIATARGCLGRFLESEMMGIIKSYLKLQI